MEAQRTLSVICRHYQDGEQLDVAGLNRITVLVDRSQTALTEVGWNFWKPDIDGPPHFHEAKEQIFLATEGEATVTISGRDYHLGPNDLLHVPMGSMHRTVVLHGEPHAYLLYNAFRDSDKEGKQSFVHHLSEAKHIRRRQADEAAAGATVDWAHSDQIGSFAHIDPALPAGATVAVESLVTRAATLRSAADTLRLGAGHSLALDLHPGSEKTLFVLAGAGACQADGATYTLGPGTVVYVPAGVPATATAGQPGLVCACLSTYLV
jgi:mannose-6-phosphate isomerase-like protein (cupin superfamily)